MRGEKVKGCEKRDWEKREEGRGKREEGRGKREEGRGKREDRTYKRCRDWYSPSLVPRLNDRSINAPDGIREGVKVADDEFVGGEVVVQDLEEIHESNGKILRIRQISCKRQAGFEMA